MPMGALVTWLLAIAVLGSIGVLAIAVAAGWWFGRRAVDRADKLGAARVRVAKVESANERWSDLLDALRSDMSQKDDEIARERAARKIVEAQRDDAMEELEAAGDPRGTAAGIRRDLDRLARMSSEVPDLSSDATTDED